eukprot:m.95724 g.95724  ORF g.95724 m.95724 type:complete len:482 (-) comp21940_c0_seq3:95-1540(-)
MEPSETFSVVIIGAGSGGLTAAEFAAKIGARVALVEANKVGGDCTWTGCVPSKALIKASKTIHTARRASALFGTGAPPNIEVDMKKVHDYVKSKIEKIYQHETPETFEAKGVRVFMGRGEFLNSHDLKITPSEGSSLEKETVIRGQRFVLCTGASAAVPPFLKDTDIPYLTYESIFDLQELPKSMTVVGGGPIGAEMAQAFNRLGSKVTIIARTILPKEDPDAQKVVTKVFVDEGMVHIPCRAVKIEKIEDGVKIITEDGQEVTSETLLVAAGRHPNVANMGLDAAGVKYTKDRIHVNSKLQTSVSHIYAAGDCIGSPQFTHYAGWQAFIAVRNFILPSSESGFNEVLPRVTFTEPEVAAVGMTEEEFLSEYGGKAHVVVRRLDRVDRAVCENDEETGFVKILYTSDLKVHGATIVCQRAGEMINEFSLAMQNDLSLKKIARAIHAYPSFAFTIQQMTSDIAVEGLFHGITGKLINLLKKV